MKTFRNPVIPGFYPDPSICRVDYGHYHEYYLVTSTFEYFPGVPIFQSRDLVHWRQIGHVLTRPSQLNLDDIQPSYGIFAPTIRYHDGTFYVVTTAADKNRKLQNFIVTATDPAGEWSEPYFLQDAPGIDPSLYFEDGRAYYTGNRTPSGQDHRDTARREIWLQELDLTTMQLTGEKIVLWDGMTKGEECPEAPHIYKIDGYYYLLVAEGGTYHTHCISIARSETLTGPYEGNRRNPILTHRNLGLDYPIACTGHGDLIQTQTGEWWMVLLATRPNGGYFYNLGRETFLVPVAWEDGFPLISPGTGRVEFEYPAPNLPEQRYASAPACDHFDSPILPPHYNFVRTPRENFWSLDARPGWMRLKLRPEQITETVNASSIGRRQQHMQFAVRTMLEFTPKNSHECAGLVLLQNHKFNFRLLCTKNASNQVVMQLLRREHGNDALLAEEIITGYEGRLYLKIEGSGMDYSFYFATRPEAWFALHEHADGRNLSTTVAEGFTGVYIGMVASSSGVSSDNHADFDYFEYQAL